MFGPRFDREGKLGEDRLVLVVDNYDSFTYNLVQYLGELGAEVLVVRNDDHSPTEVMSRLPSHIVLSPGPGRPSSAGITVDLVIAAGGQIPILGVCLGHQAIGEAFGGAIIRSPTVVHGKTSAIHHQGTGVFGGVPSPFLATRYHSLVVDRYTLPECLEIVAWTDDGLIMGLRHRTLPRLEGVQFHPESIMTSHGHQMLGNFLGCAGDTMATLKRIPA